MSGFGAVAAILAIVSAVSYYELKSVDTSYSQLLAGNAKVHSDAQQLQYLAEHQVSLLREYFITKASDDQSKLNADNVTFQKLVSEALALSSSAQTHHDLQSALQLDNEFTTKANAVLSLAATDFSGALQQADSQGVFEYGANVADTAQKVVTHEEQVLTTQNAATSKTANRAILIVLLISLIGVLLAIGLGIFISKLISKPMVKMAAVAKRVAKGELNTDKVVVKNRDEIGTLASSLNEMVDSLRTLIVQVRNTAAQVAAASEELTASTEETTQASQNIATTTQQVAVGAERASLSTEETAKSVSEMVAGIQQVSASAQGVADSASKAKTVASGGFESIERAVAQMNSIHNTVDGLSQSVRVLGKSSEEIGQMVGVITEIASQTNLLALNAAIEAARAGEHGRGFAVVADEVRKLAEQSADKAKQIVSLVAKIQSEMDVTVETTDHAGSEVETGMQLVNAAGESFQSILQSVTDVSGQIVEVSAAVEEMAAGAEEMAHTVDEVSKITQNASGSTHTISAAAEQQLASMEQISASSVSLSEMAEELTAVVSKFVV